MPTNTVYRLDWSEYGERFRLDIIPRHTTTLTGLYTITDLPKDFLRGWKVDGADFPSGHPWGLTKAPGLTLDLNFRALGSTSALRDLRTYLQEPSVVQTGAIDVDGGDLVDLRIPNTVILTSDNGEGGTPSDVVFVGCQRLLPGLATAIENIGARDYRVSTEITFAHAAMHVLESIPTDWVARRALADETPLANSATVADGGWWKFAYNLIYYDPVTARIHAFRESAPANQRFYLYDVDKMFTDHMADLMTVVYSAFLRGHVTGSTFTFQGFEETGGPLATSPPLVPRYKKPDYTTSYGVNDLTSVPIGSIYIKGKIEVPDGLGYSTGGGWYSSHSETSIYQWDTCWDMLKKVCDTCRATVWQAEAATMQINVLPILEYDHTTSGIGVVLTASDILGGRAQIDHQAGIIRSARVSVKGAGSDDRSDHETVAVGIRADEEVTAEVVFHNQVPIWDEIDAQTSDGSGEISTGSVAVMIAEIATLTTDTLYFVDTPVYDPTGANITLALQDIPIMLPPRVDIRRTRIDNAYEDGYDMSAFTPLPTTNTVANFPDMIEGAVIEMQRNACLPHVLSQYLVSEFGAGQIDKPATYELEIGRKAITRVKLRHMGQLVSIDPDIFLPDGESYWSGLPSALWLVGWSPDSKRGTVKLTLFGHDL